MKTYVILLAAGSGTRMNSEKNKIFLQIERKSVLERSLEAFLPHADEIMLMIRGVDQEEIGHLLDEVFPDAPVRTAEGGNTRQESVLNGLRALRCEDDDIILVHDCARCLVSSDIIRRVVKTCRHNGAAVPGIPAVNTIKVCRENKVVFTPDRKELFEIQTPQGIRAGLLRLAFEKALEDQFTGTDDASLLEHCGIPVTIVDGERQNIKITMKEDIGIAEMYLNHNQPPRIGMGYDVHAFAENRRLILCGVEIPYEKGLLGHSDADVALHALMDAMLGAASMGDIGKHFPDTDPQYSGADSMLLLKKTAALLAAEGYTLLNADITIVAQQPKLMNYMDRMKSNVAEAVGVRPDQISVKATTTEHLGFEGRKEGISSYAVCMIGRS